MTAEEDAKAKRIINVLADKGKVDVFMSLNVLGAVVTYVLGALDDESARAYVEHVYRESRMRRTALPADDATDHDGEP